MLKSLLFLLSILLLSACGGTTDGASTQPTATPMLTGSIDILYPQTGTIVYAESLYLSGTVADVEQLTFTLQVIGADEQIIAQTNVDTPAGDWQIELIHGYTGEPTEATIRAIPLTGDGIYDSASIIISANSYRPEGVFGSIITPGDGDIVGGDMLLVEGSVSGVFEGTFQLALINAAGTMIDEQTITAFNPYFIDEVPYQAELATNAYTGPATIRAYALSADDGSEIPLGSVSITIESSAG